MGNKEAQGMAENSNTSMDRLGKAMIAIGLAFIILTPLGFHVWPGGFRWTHPSPHPAYEHMIAAIYISLGICLIMAAKDPLKNAIIIDFTIISSILHGGVMFYDSFAQEGEMMHLAGDVPMLLVLAVALIIYHPNRLAGDLPPG
jgi:hydrogenase/urease accessory protein HupE